MEPTRLPAARRLRLLTETNRHQPRSKPARMKTPVFTTVQTRIAVSRWRTSWGGMVNSKRNRKAIIAEDANRMTWIKRIANRGFRMKAETRAILVSAADMVSTCDAGHYAVGARRRVWKRRLLAPSHPAQQIIRVPRPQNSLDARKRCPSREKANASERDNPDIAAQSAALDVQ